MRDRSHSQPAFARNKNYERDIQYTMQICRLLLRPIGIWPLIHDRSTLTEKIVSAALIITSTFILCFVLVPSALHTILREKDVYTRVKLLGPIGFALTSTVKYFYLGLRGDAFRRCIDEVKTDWKLTDDETHREIMLRNAMLGRSLSTLSTAFLYIGALSYHIVMPIWSSAMASANMTGRTLMYPGYDWFVDPQASPTYELLYLSHMLYAVVTASVTTAACSLAAILVTHACGQMQIIMSRLDRLLKDSDDKYCVKNNLNDVVRCHVRLLRFSGRIEEVLREICLMEIVVSTLTICLLEYYCMTEWNNHDTVAITTYFVLLISFTFNVFIFCYIGELLVDQCARIGLASYEVHWYNLHERDALNLVMIIAISSYPPKLTAGKIIELSFNTFGRVLKSSVVYLNLLRTVTE